MDFARSASPAVQAQLDRLTALSPGHDILGLERITALLERLGNPHHRLPPVFHVAGTNGKGSTCAFLRAALEASGRRVHVYSSPHLVRFNERIRLAGSLIEDDALAPLLAEVLDVADGIAPSFFEVTTAAAFLAFSSTPADACVIEVGLGGRLDATNVLPAPAACGIAQLGIDHEAFLGDDAVGIAGEKAGIAKPGAPLVTMAYPPPLAARVAEVAGQAGAPLLARGEAWEAVALPDMLAYSDAHGALHLPLPARLPGAHQADNAALAVAMLRHSGLNLTTSALAAGIERARWPARLQRLKPGPLTALLPPNTTLWLDGGHNPAAGEAIAAHFRAAGEPLDLILGMLANKDPHGLLAPFAGLVRRVVAVPVPDHDHHAPKTIAEAAASIGAEPLHAADLPSAIALLAPAAPQIILILGSLYLAGAALAANDEPPD